jgi:hypothetical protein
MPKEKVKKSAKRTAAKKPRVLRTKKSTRKREVKDQAPEIIFDSTKKNDTEALFVSTPETQLEPAVLCDALRKEPQQPEQKKTWWQKLFNIKGRFFSILVGLIFAGFFCTGVYVFATPPASKYAPSETLNPSCTPGSTNCSVLTPVTYTGATAALDLGSYNFTTTGTGTFGTSGILGIDAATNTAGVLKFWSAGANDFYTTFTAGTQTANATYTLPTAMPSGSSKFLQSTTAGVLSWESVDLSGYVPYSGATGAVNLGSQNLTTTGTGTFGTATRQTVLDDGTYAINATGRGYFTNGTGHIVELINTSAGSVGYFTDGTYQARVGGGTEAGYFYGGAGKYVYLADSAYAINAVGVSYFSNPSYAGGDVSLMNNGYSIFGIVGSSGTAAAHFTSNTGNPSLDSRIVDINDSNGYAINATGNNLFTVSGSDYVAMGEAGYTFVVSSPTLTGSFFSSPAASVTLADQTYAIDATGNSNLNGIVLINGATDDTTSALQVNGAAYSTSYLVGPSGGNPQYVNQNFGINNVILGNYAKGLGQDENIFFIGTNDANSLGISIASDNNGFGGVQKMVIYATELGVATAPIFINYDNDASLANTYIGRTIINQATDDGISALQVDGTSLTYAINATGMSNLNGRVLINGATDNTFSALQVYDTAGNQNIKITGGHSYGSGIGIANDNSGNSWYIGLDANGFTGAAPGSFIWNSIGVGTFMSINPSGGILIPDKDGVFPTDDGFSTLQVINQTGSGYAINATGTTKFSAGSGGGPAGQRYLTTFGETEGGYLYDFNTDYTVSLCTNDYAINATGNSLFTGNLTTTGSLVVDTNTLVVNASGYEDKVGIGTATPGAKLDIEAGGTKNIWFGQYTPATTYNAISLNESFAGASMTGLVGGGDDDLYMEAKGNMYFRRAGAIKMSLISGALGIGTTGPGKALDINSATGANLRLTYNDSDGSAANYTDFSLGSNGALVTQSSVSSHTFRGVVAANMMQLTLDTTTNWGSGQGEGIAFRDGSGHVGHIQVSYNGTTTQMNFGGFYSGGYGSTSTHYMTLKTSGLTIGAGVAGIDYTLTFDGETNDGVLTWMEDEDYFQFNDSATFSSKIYGSSGTEALPSYTFTSDTDSGFYLDATYGVMETFAGKYRISTAGTTGDSGFTQVNYYSPSSTTPGDVKALAMYVLGNTYSGSLAAASAGFGSFQTNGLFFFAGVAADTSDIVFQTRGVGSTYTRFKIGATGTITLGGGQAGLDIQTTWDGETNDGVLTWMEDEDYFLFSDNFALGTAADANVFSTSTHGSSSTTMYIGNSTINVTAPSDIRTKENITVVTDYGIDNLMQFSIKNFTYKKEIVNEGAEQKVHLGLIAQEVESVFPEAIIHRSDDFIAIDYNKLIPLIIKSVQDVKTQLDGASLSLTAEGAVGDGEVGSVNKSNSFASTAKKLLSYAGITIKDGITSITSLATRDFTSDRAEIKVARVNNIEMVASNGTIYCTWIDANGEWQKAMGECASLVIEEAQVTTEEIQQADQQTVDSTQEPVEQAQEEVLTPEPEAPVSETLEEIQQQEDAQQQENMQEDVQEDSNKKDKENKKGTSAGEIIQDAAASLMRSMWEFTKWSTGSLLEGGVKLIPDVIKQSPAALMHEINGIGKSFQEGLETTTPDIMQKSVAGVSVPLQHMWDYLKNMFK